MNDPDNRNYIAQQAVKLELATQTVEVDRLLIRIGIATKLLQPQQELTPAIAGQIVQAVAVFKRTPSNHPSLNYWRKMLAGQGKGLRRRKKTA